METGGKLAEIGADYKSDSKLSEQEFRQNLILETVKQDALKEKSARPAR
jgi:hypothetical protein